MCIGLWSCCHKLPQSWWLKTTEYSLTVLEARSLKSKYWQDHAQSEASREDVASPRPIPVFPAVLGLPCSCVTPPSAFVITRAHSLFPLSLSPECPLPFLQEHQSLG